MPTTSQMLSDYPDIVLQVLGEIRGAYLDGAENQTQAVELLAAQITDPTSVQFAYQEVVDMSELSQTALETLLKEGGEMIEAQFSRDYGNIRQMGPAKLEREQPWFNPASIAELLYYYGFIGRGFKGTGQNAHTIIYIPSDVVPWLPQPQAEDDGDGLSLRLMPIPPPPASRTLMADDTFLEDVGIYLAFIHTHGLRLTTKGPHPDDIDELVKRFQFPFDEHDTELNLRLALLLHISNRLGWLRREASQTPEEDPVIRLTGNRVYHFLEQTRPEQRLILWAAWRDSTEWNDLCRTPGLECTDTGNWKNDPLQTRQAILTILSKLQPGIWYSKNELIEAIKESEPDFQRPTGNYDTWYIRDTNTQEFLKGFEQWDQVEGALLHSLLTGALYWLQAVDLAEPSAGDDMLISFSQWGARWLGHDVPEPHENPRGPIAVHDNFTITLPLGVPIGDHFRVARFADWQSSFPHYTYQINQRSLKRASEQKIQPAQIISFLNSRSRQVSEKVVAALQRVSQSTETQPTETQPTETQPTETQPTET
ncbi:MAG: hypothetical protein AAF639_07270 [Chloroflexota bacterium]